MFDKCHSLISLPNISKWNIKNIADMSYMFRGCNSIVSFPDISKWETKNITEIFNGCLNSLNNP